MDFDYNLKDYAFFYAQIKELESQLVVERKLARQHVDTRIAENNLQQHTLHKIIDEPNKEQEEEQNSSPVIERVRHRLSLKPLTEIDTRLLNITTPTTTTKQNDAIFRELLFLKEKENKPEPRPAVKRLSLCPSAKRVPLNKPQFRRNSLATIPAVNVLAQRRPSLIPSSSNMCAGGGSNKKVSSILRRSLQKKVIIRPPIWQQVGKKGVSGLTGGGVERSRMSIGCARRVLTNNGNGGGGPSRVTTGRQVQLQHRDVEKGWNQRFGLKKL